MTAENTFFSKAYRTFTKVDHSLGHKTSLGKPNQFKSYKVHPPFTKKLN